MINHERTRLSVPMRACARVQTKGRGSVRFSLKGAVKGTRSLVVCIPRRSVVSVIAAERFLFRILPRPGVDLAGTDYQCRQQSGPCPGILKQQAAQQVKPKKPMIILGQIQQVTKQEMTDKRDPSKKSVLFQLVISDKTKPAQFRCSTPFCTFMSEEKFRAQFGADEQAAVDEPVTLAAFELTPYNAFMKVKGQLLKGHHTGDAVLAMAAQPDGKPAKPATPGK